MFMRERRFARLQEELILISFVKSHGIDRNLIEVLPETFDREVKKGEVYYYYTGPLDERTRKFCRLLLSYDKVLSERSINSISKKLGYNVLKHQGGFNCRHSWTRFRGKEILTPKITPNQIRSLDKSR